MKSLLVILLSFFVFHGSLNANILEVNKKKVKYIKNRFGKVAVKRVLYVNNYFKKNKSLRSPNNIKVVEVVNKFYNRLVYLKDTQHWRKDDYWSSLIEFIATGAGDSEDFAMAKLYTLTKLGFNRKKFFLAKIKKEFHYSKDKSEHVVLLYKHKKNSKFIILDSVNKKLKIVKDIRRYAPVSKPKEFIDERLLTMVAVR